MALNHTQNLDLSLKQQLSLTPQLQQAIKILNMNGVELALEVQQMLEQNFMLNLDNQDYQLEAIEYSEEKSSEGLLETLSEELEYDSSWEEHYDHDWEAHSPHREEENNLEQYISEQYTLDSYLQEQLAQMPLSAEARQIAEILIYHLDEDGYFRDNINEVAKQYSLKPQQIKEGLEIIKRCQPTGVGAIDLEECLNLQIALLADTTPHLETLKRIMARHFLFVAKNPKLVQERLNISENEFQQAITLLKSLDPRPGQKYTNRPPPYIEPEIIVREKGGISYIETEEHLIPSISINETYAQLVKHANAQEKTLLQAQINEARWFINAIDKRADTIRRVAGIIVAIQQDFFQEGEKAMQPLTRQKVADMLDIHESTVSRAVNGKYLMCKRGIFELRYFFSNQLETTDGEDQSTTAIKAIISDIIEKEDPKNPLSDKNIADILSEQGYKIARRTIAKYREALNIPTSSQRRQR